MLLMVPSFFRWLASSRAEGRVSIIFLSRVLYLLLVVVSDARCVLIALSRSIVFLTVENEKEDLSVTDIFHSREKHWLS